MVARGVTGLSRVAAWRLERGIFTSPGAGDMRRARAACERLVLLAADRYPEERRDLAIILLHSGDVPAARRELRAYMAAVNASANSGSVRAAAGGGAGGAGAAVGAGSSVGAGAGYWSGMGGPLGPDPFDLVLCRRLLVTLEGLGVGAGEEAEGLEAEPLSVEATLRLPPPWERAHGGGGGGQALPLTW
ncbi:hypothetical protein CHLRE_03g145067v5 [Chlamydomonas reinhardtii]|uniref:Uncharacterized protein n=1 Tax=Chlamydomonas reinhardtii TaxID=3055 RepID=A0A2K3DVA3_CHLRE|nr:uncharacterized protein CHLRE_03g145067v5 [Chlamydomonas reinhardtii]PNW84446.1 hypothetical protein CHLRE_03g145067v5 [Chlamydomonas reinhardtii]